MKKIISFFVLSLFLTTIITFYNTNTVNAMIPYRDTYRYTKHELSKSYKGGGRYSEIVQDYITDEFGTPPPDNATILTKNVRIIGKNVIENTNDYIIWDCVREFTIEYEVGYN